MTLERPWLALGTGIAAILLLWILDRLRRRPVVLLVASLDLFPENAERARDSERQKKRAWRDLLLRMLAALALALAAGGPSLEHGRSRGRLVRVLLDRSASMAAKEASGTRLELARAELARALANLSSDDRVELHLEPPDVDEPAETLSPGEAAKVSVRVVGAPGHVKERALRLAPASADDLPLLVVSDEKPEAIAGVAWASVGTPLANVGITALASRRDPAGHESLLVATSARATVEITVGTHVETRVVEGSAVASVPSGAGEARARIQGEDALSLDDEAVALRAFDAPLRVVVEPGLGAPLETALRSIPGADVVVSDERSGGDVFFLRYVAGDKDPPRGFQVYFGPAEDEVPGVTFVDHTRVGEHDFAAFFPRKVAHEVPKDVSVPEHVVDSGDHHVVAFGPRAVWIGTPPPPSGDPWARDPGFPRFFAWVLEHVRAYVAEDLVVHPTGSPLDLPRLGPGANARFVVTDPLGRKRESGPRFTPLDPGIYTVSAQGTKTEARFSAALLDPVTQDLGRAVTTPFPAGALAQLLARPASRESAPLAWLLAVAALVFA
ncbi:MAG TPA: BatA domain-containing protein, partial [Planctomycetota bacterium]|nr:BatA domain-containing protein [Planctomycetota bacterium]